MGVELDDVIRMSAINAAKAIRKEDRGTLRPGLLGDATVLEIERGKFSFVDAIGDRIAGDQQLVCRGIVLNGRW
jgi:dihydroorotase